MKVMELIEQLSKLDPELECYTLDSRSEWNCISQVWAEQDMTIDHKAIAYFESTWAMSKFFPYEVWSAQDELQSQERWAAQLMRHRKEWHNDTK